MTKEQINPTQVFQDTSHNTHLESCMHVHQPMSQVCKPGESLALRKVKHPLNGKTSVSRLPLTKQDILSQYSGCFELWISGLYEYRVTPQSSSIASPLQLITQCTPREKDLPQLPSTLGAQEMYETHQELIRKQQSKPEKNYIELTPGMPVWVQHRQNTSWEPATVVSQCNSNSYWIMQENDQPRVYRRTRTMLKIRCTDVRQTRHNYSQLTESEKAKFQTPSTSNEARNYVEHNSVENISQDLVHSTKSDTASGSLFSESEEREEIAETADVPAPSPALTPAPTLERVEEQSHTPGSRKSTRKNLGRPTSSYSDFYM